MANEDTVMKSFLALVISQLTTGYIIYTEGPDHTYRHIRNHGQRRRQLQDEIQSLFSLPNYWRSTSRSSGEKRAKRQLQQAQSRLDPTHSADSMFLLNLYNDMNDDYDPVLYSKAALDLRKRRSKGKHFYETFYQRNITEDYARQAENIVTIRNSLGQQDSNQMEKQFHFSMLNSFDPAHLNHATLRIFKQAADDQFQAQFGADTTLTLIVNQLLMSPIGPKPDKIASIQLKPADKGWVEFDLSETVRNWAKDLTSSHAGAIQIKITDDEGNMLPVNQFGLVDSEDNHEYLPFMVCYYQDENQLSVASAELVRRRRRDTTTSRKKPNRDVVVDEDYDDQFDMDESEVADFKPVFGLPNNEKSHATRSVGSRGKKDKKKKTKKSRRKNKNRPNKKTGGRKKRSGCSKERLFLNFRELGWDKYIIAPVGYAAYRCKGVCDFPLSPHVNATNHAIVQVLVSLIEKKIPKPCCAPTKLDEMTMIYHDDGNRVIMRKHRDMIVSSCGCH